MSKPKTVGEAVILESGYWLPEDCVLKFTTIELGALTAILVIAKQRGEGEFLIAKPGENGERIEVKMIDRLLEKIYAESEKFYKKPSESAPASAEH